MSISPIRCTAPPPMPRHLATPCRISATCRFASRCHSIRTGRIQFLPTGSIEATPDPMTNDRQAKLAALKAENRTLRVGGGATFEELEASGKAGGGHVYRFHDLLSLPAQSNEPTAPPLVFIHVPKTGGTTINHILMRNFRYRLDAYGSSFFPRYFPNEFVAWCAHASPTTRGGRYFSRVTLT